MTHFIKTYLHFDMKGIFENKIYLAFGIYGIFDSITGIFSIVCEPF